MDKAVFTAACSNFFNIMIIYGNFNARIIVDCLLRKLKSMDRMHGQDRGYAVDGDGAGPVWLAKFEANVQQ